MNNKKKCEIKLLLFILLLGILILTYEVWLPSAGTFLLVRDDIQKADCIVPLTGDAYFRFRKAVELYDKGYSKNIVVSLMAEREKKFDEYDLRLRLLALKDISEREFTLAAFKHFGMDTKDVYFTNMEVSSTYDEAVAAKQLMLEKGFKSLILVTSTYHIRRALLIFKLVFRGTGIKIYNCTAKNILYDPPRWWRKEKDVKYIAQEYTSIIYNIIYHFILNKGKTAFDTV